MDLAHFPEYENQPAKGNQKNIFDEFEQEQQYRKRCATEKNYNKTNFTQFNQQFQNNNNMLLRPGPGDKSNSEVLQQAATGMQKTNNAQLFNDLEFAFDNQNITQQLINNKQQQPKYQQPPGNAGNPPNSNLAFEAPRQDKYQAGNSDLDDLFQIVADPANKPGEGEWQQAPDNINNIQVDQIKIDHYNNHYFN